MTSRGARRGRARAGARGRDRRAGNPGGRIRLAGGGRRGSPGQEEAAARRPKGEDEVEIDDESLDDAAFIEETEEEDTDVTEIIGGDIENEEET